jgi:hypothetical protein
MANVIEQPRQGWPIHGPAGKATIIISGPNQPPAFTSLAFDECFTRLTLCMQRVEVLFETLFRGFPGVDRAAPDRWLNVLHWQTPPLPAP